MIALYHSGSTVCIVAQSASPHACLCRCTGFKDDLDASRNSAFRSFGMWMHPSDESPVLNVQSHLFACLRKFHHKNHLIKFKPVVVAPQGARVFGTAPRPAPTELYAAQRASPGPASHNTTHARQLKEKTTIAGSLEFSIPLAGLPDFLKLFGTFSAHIPGHKSI